MTKTIGIIGGSGLDNPDFVPNPDKRIASTLYGVPSSPIKVGMVGNCRVILLSRHGYKHQYSPSEVNYRANIYALKQAGAEAIVATTACGSLRDDIHRGDFIILDQFIDFTRRRASTFFDSFGDGAKHTPMAYPFDANLRNLLFSCANELGIRCHKDGTVITIEGPRFSTRAESLMFRQWGADVINMSVATEAALANELGIPYAAVAMSTDYDSWKESEVPVSWEEVIRVFNQNAENMLALIKLFLHKLI